jgi:ribosomal protein S12 methylthiotransferase
MQRHTTKKETIELINALRTEVPGICIRTTLMVGFPGETEDDFNELMDFVREVKFDRMGAFTYCEEEGTYAALNYKDTITDEIKQKRLDQLMLLQEEISTKLCTDKIGKTYKIIIDRIEGEYYIGRTEHDSPEVDCEVLIKQSQNELTIGNFYNVEITDATEYDLYAKLI